MFEYSVKISFRELVMADEVRQPNQDFEFVLVFP